MKLKIGNFYVKDVVFGDELVFKDGVLTLNKKEALDFIRQDEHITDYDIVIARPGEKKRIVPIKEAAEARVRLDGKPVFPGVTGDLRMCGDGELHALKNMSVMGVGKHWGSFGDGLVDMWGEGQKYTYFGNLINVCLVIDTDEEFERYEQQKKNRAIRDAVHKFAEYLGQAVKDLQPEDTEVYELEPITKRDEKTQKLPSVVLVMQPRRL